MLPILMLIAAWCAGIFVGVAWAESEIIKERVRAAWRKGYQAGRETFIGAQITFLDRETKQTMIGEVCHISPSDETAPEATERLIRETRP